MRHGLRVAGFGTGLDCLYLNEWLRDKLFMPSEFSVCSPGALRNCSISAACILKIMCILLHKEGGAL